MSADVILNPSSANGELGQDMTSPGPFEGPEKLLEVWFAPSVDTLPRSQTSATAREVRIAQAGGQEYVGLRKVPRQVWEEMLDIVKCKVLSVVEGEDIDAYLLSESSLFVAPHLLILKTCGTTLNLLGLHRIIEIARQYCGFNNVWRCFYSRKSFFFPERQSGPHKDWRDEVNFLDGVFEDSCWGRWLTATGSAGSAYTVGPMNRDHWLLYLTSPNTQPLLPSDSSLTSSFHLSLPSPSLLNSGPSDLSGPSNSGPSAASPLGSSSKATIKYEDTTLEILMSHLSPAGRAPFMPDTSSSTGVGGHELGKRISYQVGIHQLFGEEETVLDSFGFDPCGYSANAVIGSGLRSDVGGQSDSSGAGGGGYFTIHVTPEDGWSYASFECNVPLPPAPTHSRSSTTSATTDLSGHSVNGDSTSSGSRSSTRPDLPTLIKRVVDIFQPNRLSITLFVSTPSSPAIAALTGTEPASGLAAEVESQAWQAFRGDLLGRDFERTDRIGYEFQGYDLIFACFQRRGWVEPKRTGGLM